MFLVESIYLFFERPELIGTCDGEKTSKESAFLVPVSYLCLELTAAYKMRS